MKERNYWQQFLNTGSIESYLSFKKEQDGRTVSKWDKDGVSGDHIVMGDNPYAGICEINRNGFEDSAYRGIR